MSDGIEAQITGLPDLKAALAGIAPKLRKRALRNALAAGARIVRDEAVRNRKASSMHIGAPATNYVRGTVAKAIKVRTSKVARSAGDVGVFINVKPLARSSQSRKNPLDPFYWRWLEFGTKFMRAQPFLTPAISKLGAALAKFVSVIGPQIERLDKNPKDPL